jgi:DNA-binding transcriptional MerR regulator
MTEAALWTLDELVQLASQALSVDYDGPPSARVRDVPDRRLVRWYVTRGLVDRPATNGRNALYGRRHLLQLVAIKRLQAQGRSLAEIQAELAGAPDRALDQLARLDPVPPAAAPPVPTAPQARTAPSTPAMLQDAGVRTRFWVDRPATPGPPAPAGADQAFQADQADQALPPARTTWPLQAIELSPGITLLVDPTRTVAADPDAVRHAARQLLDLLVPATTNERSTS